MKRERSLSFIVLLVLALEKLAQHMFVTYAFISNLGGIRGDVSLDYRIFMISGFLVGILFLVAFIMMVRHNPVSLRLLFYLSLFDLIGEFVAQGRVFITITVSLLIATAIIVIVYVRRKRLIAYMSQDLHGEVG
jgi:uncharacterized membrane protein (UPF0136 family)